MADGTEAQGILTFGNVHSVSSKAGALPNQSALLGKQWGNLPADELVADRLFAVGIQLVCVGHLPGSRGGAVVIRHSLQGCGEFGLLGVKGVAVLVLCASDLSWTSFCIHLKDSVVWTVNIRIDTQTK